MRAVVVLLLLAAGFWVINFAWKPLNFWLSMSIAVTVLTLLSVRVAGWPLKRADWSWRAIRTGILSAAALYSIFWLGNALSTAILQFAKPQIASIYGIRTQGELIVITLVLLFVTSPGEEIFWRGFVQRRLVERFGATPGWLLASAIYAAVHIASGNFMLTMAALTAGLFWGWLYRTERNLVPCIISHALWTVTIFVLLPIT